MTRRSLRHFQSTRRKATNQREGRKKPRELLIFLFQRLQPACPSFLTLLRTFLSVQILSVQKERRKKNMESSRSLLKISFLIPSLFFLSLYDYLSQMNREERGKKVSNGKFVRGIAKIIRFSKKSFVDYGIFKFKF